jgi:thioesterase domain-containing protein
MNMNGATALSQEALTDLERTLHAEIPLTRAMGVRVVRADHNGLVLGAALAPNLNHKQTAFGGSLNSLATLACWGLIQLLVRDCGRAITVVIQESHVQFLKPVTQDFEAICPPPPAAVHEKFLRTLERKGRARLELEATIHSDGEVALRFRGQFVAYDRARFQGFEPASVV